MLAAALSALVLAATPAELCARCEEVRGLVDKYPVLAQEIHDTCSQVPPGAPCADDARRAVEAADRLLAESRCGECTSALARLDSPGKSDPAALAKHVRETCDAVPKEAPCAATAAASGERVSKMFHGIAEPHVRAARLYAVEGEDYRALEELQRARAIEPADGIDFELRAYEAAARARLDVLGADALRAIDRGDERRAMEIVDEIGRISAPLHLQEIHLRVLLEVLERVRRREADAPPGTH